IEVVAWDRAELACKPRSKGRLPGADRPLSEDLGGAGFHLLTLQSSSAFRFTAGASGFLLLSQSRGDSASLSGGFAHRGVTAITELRFCGNRCVRPDDIGMCAEKRGAEIVVLDEERRDHGQGLWN